MDPQIKEYHINVIIGSPGSFSLLVREEECLLQTALHE